MSKQKIGISTLILVSLLFISAYAPVASAYKASANWGSYYLQTPDEITTTNDVCQHIYNTLDSAYNWDAVNFAGTQTTATNIYQTNTNVKADSTCAYLATFHAGNWYCSDIEGYRIEFIDNGGWVYPEWVSAGYTRHYNFYPNNGVGGIEDRSIPGCAKAKFTFIYTCMNGGLYWNSVGGQIVEGPTDAGNQHSGTSTNNAMYAYLDTDKSTGEVGMPYKWLGDTSRSTNGYLYPDSSGYCYIGFQGRDPDLYQVWEQGSYSGTPRYADWVKEFYNQLSQGVTVKQALDGATNTIDSSITYFSGCSLYKGYDFGYDTRIGSPTFHQWVLLGQMRVLGDSSIKLV